MNTQLKEAIQKEVIALAGKTSQNKVATQAGVSSATISQIINGKWDAIADEMWRKIQNNLSIHISWVIAPTFNLKQLHQLLKVSQSRSMSVAVAYDAGAGKSVAYRTYSRQTPNVIYIECKNYWTKKSYVKQLCKAAGIRNGTTTEEMIEALQEYLSTLDKPLIIIDQFDKLKDSSLDLFMDMYNALEGRCGFVLSGVPAFEKRIKRGVQHDKIGFKELYSRIGRSFIKLKDLSLQDVTAICSANGLEDKEQIRYIYNNSEGDIRRVRRDVERLQVLKAV